MIGSGANSVGVRDLAASAGWSFARRAGLTSLARHAHRERLLVLCYHGVAADADPRDWLLLPAARFHEQLEFLSRAYDVLPLDVALDRLSSGELREPTAAITFDDGYANNYSVALPILEHLGVPAVIYLTTELIERGGHLWTTRVERSVAQSKSDALDVGDPRVDGPLGDIGVRRQLRGRQVKDVLKGMSDREREVLLHRILEQLGDASDLAAFRLLTAAELNALDRSGIVMFGAHTKTHPILATLDDQRLREEITGSIMEVAKLRHVSNTFAYPNGRPQDFDGRAIAVLQECGIRAGLSTTYGLQRSVDSLFHVRRVLVGGDMSMSQFVAATSGLRGWLPSRASE